ncbi:MAG TPA: hypothetical protein VM925_08050 [Labilithrix sp.]|nr:hypothetical protein [Labilithrix sp.]
MNSSAKITAFSFLAAAALGAAVFTGCTVTSGTVDDTDGGTTNNGTDAGTQSETGTGTDSGPTCEPPTQGTPFEPAADCQPCVAANCCAELVGCFSLPGGDKLDCDGFKECVDSCDTDDCINGAGNEGSCVNLAAPGVAAAYQAISECGEQKCATQCPVGNPDAGADGG